MVLSDTIDLGDSVFLRTDNQGVFLLCTDTGDGPQNIIYMSKSVIEKFIKVITDRALR
jgi:hypothetical protein